MIDTIKAQIRWESMPVKTNAERLKVLRAEEERIMRDLILIEGRIAAVKEEMTRGGRGV